MTLFQFFILSIGLGMVAIVAIVFGIGWWRDRPARLERAKLEQILAHLDDVACTAVMNAGVEHFHPGCVQAIVKQLRDREPYYSMAEFEKVFVRALDRQRLKVAQ